MFGIDPRSVLPVYEQLKRRIRFLVVSGKLCPGERLPSIRELAVQLRVNPNTVAKVYSQLEWEGYVRSRAGSGVFVADEITGMRLERLTILSQFTDEYIARAVELGFSPGEIQAMVNMRMEGEASGQIPRSSRADSGSAVKRQ